MALRRQLLRVTAAIAMGAGAGALASGVSAAVASAAPGGAMVISGAGCGLADGNGNAVFVFTAHTTITSSGNTNERCDAPVAPSSNGGAVRYDYASTGAMCSTPSGSTSDWQETISASGNASLICHLHG